MINKNRITSVQLGMLLVGFIIGSSAIITPAVEAKQDVWLSYILAWLGGYLTIAIYVYIAKLNHSLTLVEILKAHFGKFFGTIISILYIWYFIHLGSLVIRNVSEFMITSIYTETPLLAVVIAISVPLYYGLRKGLVVFSKLSELIVPFMILLILIIFLLVFNLYEFKNFLPFFEQGFLKISKVAFFTLTFPFAETVVFLMIFPYTKKYNNLLKTSYISLTVSGLVLFSIIISNLLVLGGDILANSIFPSHLTISLIPKIAVEPFVSINILVGTTIKIYICIYSALIGIKQILNVNDHKPFITPVLVFSIILAIWIYDNLIKMIDWAGKIYPFYAIPFQFIFPILILSISLIKKIKSQQK